jgi:hypothetical protein
VEKKTSAGMILPRRNTLPRHFVKTADHHSPGYQKAARSLLFPPGHWMGIPGSGQRKIFIAAHGQPGTQMRVPYRNMKRCRRESKTRMMLISADEVWTLGIQLSFLYSRQSIFFQVN